LKGNKLTIRDGVVGVPLDCGYFFQWVKIHTDNVFIAADKAHSEECKKCGTRKTYVRRKK